MTERTHAVAALDRLAAHDAKDASRVGKFLAHLETQNDRLAQHAAAAGKVLLLFLPQYAGGGDHRPAGALPGAVPARAGIGG